MPPGIKQMMRAARKFGLKFEGIQQGLKPTKTSKGFPDTHMFTDPKTKSTLMIKNSGELESKVLSSRKKFGVGPGPKSVNLTSNEQGFFAGIFKNEADRKELLELAPSAKMTKGKLTVDPDDVEGISNYLDDVVRLREGEKIPPRIHSQGLMKKLELGTGVGVGAIAAHAAAPEEAEAFPIGKFVKKAASEIGGSVSSTAKRIAGAEIRGRKIATVRKAQKGDWRYLIFEDGTSLPITKDYLESLTRAVGTGKQLKKLGTKSLGERSGQARISLGRRAQSKGSLGDVKQTRAFKEADLERVRELDPALVPETVYVKHEGETLFMPRAYAEILEKEGQVQILKGAPKVGKRPFKDPFER